MTRKALVIVIFGNEYQIKKSNLIEKISDRIDKINEDEDTSFTKKKIEEDILDNKSRKTFTQNVLKTMKGEISSSEKRVSRILTVIEQQDISNDNKNEIEKINNEWKENMQCVLENMQDKALDIEEILQKEEETINEKVQKAIEEIKKQNVIEEKKKEFRQRISQGIEISDTYNSEDIEEDTKKSKLEKWIEDVLK